MTFEHPLPAFPEKNLGIVFCIDNAYVKYFSVALQSIIEQSSADFNYDISILTKGIDKEKQNKIYGQVSEFENFSIRFWDIKKLPYFEKTHLWETARYITIETYYRLFIPLIFKNYAKVLYLDSDIIVLKDISAIFDIEFHDNLIAGVKDMWDLDWGLDRILPDPHPNITVEDYLKNHLNLENREKYINGGVCLFNVEGILEEELQHSLIEFPENKVLLWNDQCAINSFFRNRILLMDSRWNVFRRFYFIQHRDADAAQKIMDDPFIFHFASGQESFFEESVFAGKWRKLAAQTPFSHEIYSKINEFMGYLNFPKLSWKIQATQEEITQCKAAVEKNTVHLQQVIDKHFVTVARMYEDVRSVQEGIDKLLKQQEKLFAQQKKIVDLCAKTNKRLKKVDRQRLRCVLYRYLLKKPWEFFTKLFGKSSSKN